MGWKPRSKQQIIGPEGEIPGATARTLAPQRKREQVLLTDTQHLHQSFEIDTELNRQALSGAAADPAATAIMTSNSLSERHSGERFREVQGQGIQLPMSTTGGICTENAVSRVLSEDAIAGASVSSKSEGRLRGGASKEQDASASAAAVA